jgi:ArsR family transcriptional regulator, arsenate/arsenite/antimonite-responsive transcriptional repressor
MDGNNRDGNNGWGGMSELNNTPGLQDLCKVLLNEDRLMILGLLAQRTLGSDELKAQLPAQSSAALRLARHLQQLQTAGLVQTRNDGGVEVYQLDIDQIQALKRQLFSNPADEARTPEEKTLAAFVKEGALVQLPVQPAKLLLVLRWLVNVFEPGKAYTERDVNDLLKGHAVDHATLRRLLVDHGLLTREAGVYGRVEGA